MKEIIIFCPGDIVSGGVNSLHNLCASLSNNGFNASMYYFNRNSKILESKEIKSYGVNEFQGTIDKVNQILIVSESQIERLFKYKKASKVIYWLGLIFYFKNPTWQFPFNYKIFRKLITCKSYAGHHSGLVELTQRKLFEYAKNQTNIWISDYIHLSNSYFVTEYCKKRGANNAFTLLNPVRDEIYSNSSEEIKFKKNKVLFGQRTPKLIVALAKLLLKNFEVVKIKNMPYDEVVKLMMESKVFAELGINHGRDRMPREAAMLGCVVFMNRRGSSSNKKDYKIKNEYILKNGVILYLKNLMKIKSAAKNYPEHYKNFEDFKLQLIQEKRDFDNNVITTFNQIVKLG